MKFDTQKAAADDSANLHPEGKFDAVVTASEAKLTKTGKPMIQLTWKTSEGKLKSWHAYIAEYPGLFLKPMGALGLTAGYFEGDPEMDDVALDCLKRTATLEIKHEVYQGNITAAVANVLPSVVDKTQAGE